MGFRTELHWVDVNPHLASGEKNAPLFFLERPLLHGETPNAGVFNTTEVARHGKFWTLTSPMGVDPPAWTQTYTGQYVRVPIYGYMVPMANGAVILATGFELATRFVEALRRRVKEEIEVLHLILHNQTHSQPNGSVRLYAGVTIEVKD
jgi:hypothetical protein